MKEKALYHLMQLRARQLSNSMQGDMLTKMKEIQSSISIQREAGSFFLEWKIDKNTYQLSLESDPFHFYEKGDIQKKIREATELNYRLLNWQAAGELWRQILKTSGFDQFPADDGKMSFIMAEDYKEPALSVGDLILATVVALIAAMKAGFFQSVIVLCIILLFILTAKQYSFVHLRKVVNWSSKVAIAIGAVVPLLFGVTLSGVIFIVSGLYLVMKGESITRNNLLFYLAAGLSFGAGTYVMGWYSAVLAMLLGLFIALISAIDRQRVNVTCAALFFAGLVVSSTTLFVAQYAGLIPLFTPQSIHLETIASSAHLVVLLFLMLATFLIWWIIGVQYYLLPWLSMLALFLASIFALVSNRADIFAMLTVFSGFLLFLFTRALAGLFASMRKADNLKV